MTLYDRPLRVWPAGEGGEMFKISAPAQPRLTDEELSDLLAAIERAIEAGDLDVIDPVVDAIDARIDPIEPGKPQVTDTSWLMPLIADGIRAEQVRRRIAPTDPQPAPAG